MPLFLFGLAAARRAVYHTRMVKRLRELVDALERGRRFITHDIWHIGRPGEEIPSGFIIKQLRVAFLLMQGLVKDDLMVRAAALTFVTVLSLVPLLVVLLMVIQTLDLERDISTFISDQLFQRVAQHEGLPPPGSSPVTTPDAVNGSVDGFQDPVHWLIEKAQQGAHPKTLGVTGLVFVVTCVF